MPRVPTIVSGGRFATPSVEVPAIPSGAGVAIAGSEAFGDISKLALALGRIGVRQQKQSEDLEVLEARSELESAIKVQLAEFERTPVANETEITARGIGFKKDAQQEITRIAKGLSPNAQNVFLSRARAAISTAAGLVQIESRKQLTLAHQARIDAQLSMLVEGAQQADDLDDLNRLVASGRDLLARSVEHSTFSESAAIERFRKFRVQAHEDFLTSVAANDPLAALKMVSRGDFSAIDRQKAEGIVTTQGNAQATRAARIRDELKRENEEAQDALTTDITTLISQRQSDKALSQVELAAKHRTLPASKITDLRKLINNPGPVISDQRTRERVLSDVQNLTTTLTFKDIDNLGPLGTSQLTLEDVIAAKSRLRAISTVLKDETKSTLVRDHQQAEQTLQAMTGTGPGLIASRLGFSPPARVYNFFLAELNRRSALFGGTENPLAVVETFRPRIVEALKTSRFTSEEMQAIFPTLTDLEQARDRKFITQEQFEDELNVRTGVAPPAGAQRQSGAPVGPSPAEKPTKTKRKSRFHGTE